MPGGDRTGPLGLGPKTGRAAGYCAGFGAPGYANPAPGRGFGMGYWRRPGGRGRGGGFGVGGRGWRHRCYATGQPGWMRFGGYARQWTQDPRSEKQTLQAEADAMQAELESIRKRLSELETESTSE